MSGHNKWSSIKHKKGITDAKKSQTFSKLSKLISIAARGGGDPSSNSQLQAVIDQARKVNMPKDKIQKAISRATDKDAATLIEITLQIMAFGGVAVIVEAITDNTNRTISELKTLITKSGAKMAAEGSLAYMFDKVKTAEGFEWQAKFPVSVDESTKERLEKFFEALDDHDDVESVFSNLQQ